MEIRQGAPEPRKTRYWALYMLRPDESVLFGPGEYSLSSLRASVAYSQRRYGKRFTSRLQPDGGIRVWRVDGTKWTDMKPAKKEA
jgi:hypothetical protein